MKYSIKIGHLFSDLLNMYGDKGNIAALKKRLKWRDHEAVVISHKQGEKIDFDGLDIILLGGGGEKDDLAALKMLTAQKAEIKEYVESGGVLLAFCGGFQMLGDFYKTKTEVSEGLNILNISHETGERFIGNVIAETEITGEKIKIAGFENHGARMNIGNHTPFAKVIKGKGNNGEDGMCGVVYKNVIGTFLHGPLLPKNPRLTDYILAKAIEKKYGETAELVPLSDTFECEAHEYALKRFLEEQ